MPIVATLGPSGTCSEEVALSYVHERGWANADALKLCPSFEEAVALVLNGSADEAIVPAAYANYHELVFRNIGRLRVRSTLFSKTPAFILAGKRRLPIPDAVGRRYRVASHRSPSPLLERLTFPLQHIEASSNSAAAQLVAQGGADLCITQRAAVAAVNKNLPQDDRLEVITHFGAVGMLWGVFERGGTGDEPEYSSWNPAAPEPISPWSVTEWLTGEGMAPSEAPERSITIDMSDPDPGFQQAIARTPPCALFVDNDPAAFTLVPEAFPDWQWTFASSAAKALEATAAKDFAAALLDIGLLADDEDDSSGTALLNHLKQRFPSLAILMITGYSRGADIAAQCFRSGAIDYMTKPLDYARLRAWLSLLARRHSATHATSFYEVVHEPSGPFDNPGDADA
jgi:CheY-like chemotaxis protein